MKRYSPHWKSALVVVVLGGILVLTPPAGSAPLPVPPDMQKDVNQAIEAGMDFLKQTQGPFGSWTLMGKHQVGYAALPGLTLLDCGMKPSDPIVQKAAACVRWWAGNLDTTYDLALAILFLDKLGDPRDKTLIQIMAVRLMAGQTGTGGWSYKCPILTKQDHSDILKMLRKLTPPQLLMPLARQGEKGDPRFIRRPGDRELPTGIPVNGRPGDLKGIPGGSAGKDSSKSLPTESLGRGSDKSLPRDPGAQRNRDPLGTTDDPQSRSTFVPDQTREKAEKSSPPSRPHPAARCIKTAEGSRPEEPAAKRTEAPRPKTPRRVMIPPHLLRVAVLNDPGVLMLADPRNKLEQPMWGTTDNSNSQFAILALWAARKHDVPMIRTLNLIARRYYTSQNFDGGWSYRYHFGGDGKTTPAMTCVGLLGLAVAHGLAHELGVKPALVQDPRVINGFLALHERIGNHTGAWKNLPMQNLYFLWSVERVGVLFDLATIGDKNWYRWGAEVLLANQQPNGNWDKGGYHGATPPLDTCLALLFLKRASLTGDLRQKLPFKPGELAKAIQVESPPPAVQAEKLAAATRAMAKLDPPSQEPRLKAAESTGPHGFQKGNNLLPSEIPMRPAEAPDGPAVEEGSNTWACVLAGLALVLVLAGAVVLLLPGRKKEPAKPRRRRARSSPKLAES